MNGLHDNAHKRTSINELLNPVASSSPSGSLDAAYSPSQLNSSSYASPHQQHVSPSPSHYAMNGGAGSSFSLSPASWDHASSENQLATQRRQETEASTSSCRYGSSGSHSHQPNSHSVYPDQYQRPRTADEPSNYGMDVTWSPASHESSPAIPYAGQMVPAMYSDDRGGTPAYSPFFMPSHSTMSAVIAISTDPAQKGECVII